MKGLQGLGLSNGVKVVTTDNGGHSVDTLASLCVDKLFFIEPGASPEVLAQAEAYKENLRDIIRVYLLQAKKSERTTIAARLYKAGFEEAANFIGVL